MQDKSVFGTDPHEAARQTWGGDESTRLDTLRGQRSERIHLLPITDIVPDLHQPRRAVPSSVRAVEPAARYGISWLQAWSDQIGFHLSGLTQDIIDGQWEAPDGFEARPVEQSWLALLDLAGSIRRDGLSNPISVARQDNLYVIETGERRWLAYCLLQAYYGDDYLKIPARIVERFDVWRQASENNARSDLNAIGRTRQFAILLMDLAGIEQFQPFEVFAHERDFYAQVADISVPYGRGSQLLGAMGLRSRSQLSSYRRFLDLPPDVWLTADDESWSEAQLFSVLNDLQTPPAPPDESASLDTIFPAETAESETIRVVITDKTGDKPEPILFSPVLRGEWVQVRRNTQYVLNTLKTANPHDRAVMDEIARRAEDIADYWARVAQKARG